MALFSAFNTRRTFWLALLAICAGFLALSACSSEKGKGMTGEPPLKGANIGGDFTLTDQDGQPFSSDSLKGKYRIIYFGYSYCPDVCPVDLQKIMQGFAAFEKAHPERAQDIQPIFISVDSQRDTPERMKTYVNAFHPRLIGLTGDTKTIEDVAQKFLIVYAINDEEDKDNYLVDHSRQAYLFGKNGEPLALLPFDGTPDEIAAEIDKWTQ